MRISWTSLEYGIKTCNFNKFDDAHYKSQMLVGVGFGPNPFISSMEWVDRYCDVVIHCAEAKIISLEQVRVMQMIICYHVLVQSRFSMKNYLMIGY